MVKQSSKNGHISTFQLCPLERWGLGLAILPSTTAGDGGIGEKSWGWVRPTWLGFFVRSHQNPR